MVAISSTEAKRTVQLELDKRKEASLFHKEDKEVIGVIAGKHEAERQRAEAAAQRMQEKIEAQRRREEEQAEADRLREEQRQEARAECRKNLRNAIPASLALCSLGALHIVGVNNPDVALTAGGILVLSGLLYAGLAVFSWRRC